MSKPARPSTRRYLLRLLRALVVSLLSIGLLLWLFTPVMLVASYLRAAPSASTPDPALLGFPVEAVSWHGRDGVTLRGWLGVAESDAPLILLGHGYRSIGASLSVYAHFLYAAGYSVLLMDYRGAGMSGGDQLYFGARESGDTSAAIDYLLARPDLKIPKFGGLGVSMGAGLMLLAAAQDHRLAAIVCDSTYATLRPAFEQWDSLYMNMWPYKLSLAPVATVAASFMLDGHLDDLDPVANAAKVAPTALLVIHSAKDSNSLTPPDGARRIYEAAQEPRELVVLPEGGHAAAYRGQPEEYERQVLGFLDKYLR